MVIEYDSTNVKECQISLCGVNIPINWLKYYILTSLNSYVNIDQFGRLFAYDEAIDENYSVIGKFKLNPIVKFIIT